MRIVLLLVLTPLVAPACMAEQEWKAVGAPFTAALDVDAQGHVVHVQLVGKNVLPQLLQSLTEKTTRNWRFVPATVDGKPVSARTFVLFHTQMEKIGDNEQLRLHYIANGPDTVFLETPSYPWDMTQQRVGAYIVVAFNVNGDGSVSDVHIDTAKTSDGVRGAAFYKASIEAIERGRFLPELVDGRPVVSHMHVPFTFAIQGGDSLRHARDAPHDKVGKDNIDLTHFANIPVATDSPLRLVTTQP